MLGPRLPIDTSMKISGASAAAAQTERAVLVLKKQQDTQKAQAQALLDLVNNASLTGVGTRINTYA
jgi:hypothetical protein